METTSSLWWRRGCLTCDRCCFAGHVQLHKILGRQPNMNALGTKTYNGSTRFTSSPICFIDGIRLRRFMDSFISDLLIFVRSLGFHLPPDAINPHWSLRGSVAENLYSWDLWTFRPQKHGTWNVPLLKYNWPKTAGLDIIMIIYINI